MQKKDNIRKLIIIVSIILLFIWIAGLFVYGFSLKAKAIAEEAVSSMQSIDKEEIKEKKNENVSEETLVKMRDHWTVAAFGLDSRNGNLKRANSDVIMIMDLDGKTGAVKLVSVYRDTCLKTGERSYKKANAAYAAGGPSQAVEMLNENLDIEVDDYIAVNWKGVADAINILGGVDIDVTKKEFRYINAFITETVKSTGIGSTQLKETGTQHLDGVQTVAYCRLRLSDDDFHRTERQRKVMELVLEKAKKADEKTLKRLITDVLPETSSSIDTDDLYAAAANILKLHVAGQTGFPEKNFCRTIYDGDYVFPNTLSENVSSLHEFLYGETNYTPSETVRTISEAVRSKSMGGNRHSAPAETAPTAQEIPEETTAAEEETKTQSTDSGYVAMSPLDATLPADYSGGYLDEYSLVGGHAETETMPETAIY